jgi:hypothetical protein
VYETTDVSLCTAAMLLHATAHPLLRSRLSNVHLSIGCINEEIDAGVAVFLVQRGVLLELRHIVLRAQAEGDRLTPCRQLHRPTSHRPTTFLLTVLL